MKAVVTTLLEEYYDECNNFKGTHLNGNEEIKKDYNSYFNLTHKNSLKEHISKYKFTVEDYSAMLNIQNLVEVLKSEPELL